MKKGTAFAVPVDNFSEWVVNGSCNLTVAKATGAGINSFRSSVYNGLDSFYIWFPGSV